MAGGAWDWVRVVSNCFRETVPGDDFDPVSYKTW